MEIIYVIMYLATITLANVLAAIYGPYATILNAFFLIGFDLVARDRLHDLWRHKNIKTNMFLLILAGGILSASINIDALPIAIASTIAFAVSAIVDSVVYGFMSRRNYSWMQRSNTSNIFSSITDSILFPTIAFGVFMPLVVLGHSLVKILGGLMWSSFIAHVGIYNKV